MSDKYIKVADYPNLVRDSNTGAILNTNQSKIKKAIAVRNAAIAEKTKFNQRLDDLHSNLADTHNNLRNVINHVDNIDQTLERLGSRLETLQNKFDNVNQDIQTILNILKSK